MGRKSKRIKWLTAMFCIAFLFLLSRLVQLQILDADELSGMAAGSRARFFPGEVGARGEISDRNGLSLIDSGLQPAAVVFSSMIEDKAAVVESLSGICGLPQAVVDNMLTGQGPSLVPNLSVEEAENIADLNLRGVYVVPVKVRYGPESLARHLVGHVNSLDAAALKAAQGEAGGSGETTSNPDYISDAVGVKGIEAVYEDVLRGGEPEFFLSLVQDARGDIIPGLSFEKVVNRPVAPRGRVTLTIDRRLQEKVETVMDARVKRGAVVVMDVHTGDILAMASRPNYNQNFISEYLDAGPDLGHFNNKALEYYHPGSVFKILIAAAALEEGLVSPDELFFCTGNYVFESGLTIGCWVEEGHGALLFRDGLAHSCNPVFIETALRLGRSKILDYAEEFGLKTPQVVGYPVPAFN